MAAALTDRRPLLGQCAHALGCGGVVHAHAPALYQLASAPTRMLYCFLGLGCTAEGAARALHAEPTACTKLLAPGVP